MSEAIDRMLREARARARGASIDPRQPGSAAQALAQFRENLYVDSGGGKMTSYRLDLDAPCILPRHFSRNPRLLDV